MITMITEYALSMQPANRNDDQATMSSEWLMQAYHHNDNLIRFTHTVQPAHLNGCPPAQEAHLNNDQKTNVSQWPHLIPANASIHEIVIYIYYICKLIYQYIKKLYYIIYIYNFIVSVCKQKIVCSPVTQKLSVVWQI